MTSATPSRLAAPSRHHVSAGRIVVDSVVLPAPTVPAPVAVRDGWGDDPLCNLVNRAGLPAFRSGPTSRPD